MDDTKGKVRFRPPPNFVPPEGLQNGDTFDVVDTYQVEEGGTVCLVKMGEADMPGYGKNHKESPKPDYGDYARSMPKPGMESGETMNQM